MIVKIKSRKNQSFWQLIEYMLHDTDRLSPKERGFVIAHGLRGNTVLGWVKQLKEHEATRVHKRKNSVVLTHEILSYHADDANSITPEKLERMTREYIRLRGNGKFLAVPHYDKSHYHVHILVSGVDVNGKAMRMSRSELCELKKKIQQYQVERFPELAHSLPTHGRKSKARLADKEVQYRKRTGKTSSREQVIEIVRSCHMQAMSKQDFYERLEIEGLKTYCRGGKVYGVQYAGRNYRFGRMGFEIEVIKSHSQNMHQETELEKVRSFRRKRSRSRSI